MQEHSSTSSRRIASRRLARAVTLLHRAGRQLDGASHASPDRFHRDRLLSFATGLRELAVPLSRIASSLEKGECQVTGALRRGNPATPRQEQLIIESNLRRTRPTQADVIVDLLREERAAAEPLELPEIMAAGIAQHSARMREQP
jgi:hypothetical protein